jgi:branched-chain amino acid transport system ATP-binding protein
MLAVESLTAAYGEVKALTDASLTVADGSITAVLGANGAGKTTLLRTISGLVRPSAGRVVHDGRQICGRRAEDIARGGIAHVPEGRGVIQELTVDENLRLGGLARRDRAGLRRGLADAYELFPALAVRRRQPAFTLSGGERQMLAIGRALVSRLRVLLLDEPSLGLAPLIVKHTMELIRRLRDEVGLAVLLVEQNARSALSIADTAVVLSLGRVVVSGPAPQLALDEGLRHAYLGF